MGEEDYDNRHEYEDALYEAQGDLDEAEIKLHRLYHEEIQIKSEIESLRPY